MKFLRAVASGFANAFNFRGRTGRRDFWFWVLFVLLGWLAMLQIDISFVGAWLGYLPGEEGAPQPLNLAFLALCAIPTLSLIIRRVHDHDQPAWKALLVVPLLWWLVAKGTKGPNRFG